METFEVELNYQNLSVILILSDVRRIPPPDASSVQIHPDVRIFCVSVGNV